MVEKEIWKSVVGYEGLYEISSIGRLKRLEGYSKRIRKGYKDDLIHHKDCILKHRTNKKGYLDNELIEQVNGVNKKRKMLVHREVAKAFIGMPPIGKPQTNHKNGIKDDNLYTNLEWCNNSENQVHARATGLRLPNDKSWDCSQSFPVEKVDYFTGITLKTYGSIQEAERETGIWRQNIIKTCKGRRNSAGGYFWRYHIEN